MVAEVDRMILLNTVSTDATIDSLLSLLSNLTVFTQHVSKGGCLGEASGSIGPISVSPRPLYEKAVELANAMDDQHELVQ